MTDDYFSRQSALGVVGGVPVQMPMGATPWPTQATTKRFFAHVAATT